MCNIAIYGTFTMLTRAFPHMQATLRYIAVDDNDLDLLAVTTMASAYPFLQKAETYNNALDAMSGIAAFKPDVLFLDVEMPGWNGVELLRTVREQVPVSVFITSHPDFALDGYELDALDYVLKPLTPERFAITARRISEYWELKQKADAYAVQFEQETITVRQSGSEMRIPTASILYLEALKDYTRIVTTDKSYMTLSTLAAFLEQLPAGKLRRIHRSHAVAVDKITAVHTGEVEVGGHRLPVGKTYRREMARLKL